MMMAIRPRTVRSRSFATLLQQLTPREREVLTAVARGLTNRQTGELLGISHRTVEVHRARLMRKLEVASVAELVGLYAVHGLKGARHPVAERLNSS